MSARFFYLGDKMNIPYKIYLSEKELPTSWYNLVPLLKDYSPLINATSNKPVTEAELNRIFTSQASKQELNNIDEYIEIPEGIRDFYKMYRPSPLIRAYWLEKYLDTPAKIFYKFEGNNTSGSHKLNSAVAQAYYAKQDDLEGLTTETGAGQWGTALAMACSHFGLDLRVYMVRSSYELKPQRKTLMRVYGAEVIASPSDTTETGRKMLENKDNYTGSLGTAISEAIEVANKSNGTRKYALGSVLNQVMLHQSIVGLESKTAMEKYDEYPDIVIGCAGGGSNLGGIIAPFMADRIKGKRKPYFIAVEPTGCPTLTKGVYAYDYCDTGKVAPKAKMYTLGSGFMPSGTHAGGLRYHGMSPILSNLYNQKLLDEAIAVSQTDVFKAATEFARVEGILPAPESAHAIKVAMDEAIKCKECGEKKTILFGLTGTGYFDMMSYEKYLDGVLTDTQISDEYLSNSTKGLK